MTLATKRYIAAVSPARLWSRIESGLSPGWWAAMATIAAVAGVFVVTPRVLAGGLWPIVFAAGALAAWAVNRWPYPSAAVLLALTCTLFITPVGRFTVLGLQSDLAEVIVALFVVSFAGRALTSDEGSPYSASIVILIVAIVVGIAVGTANGADQSHLIGAAKAFATYLLIVPLGYVFSTVADKQRLERLVIGVATVGAAAVVAAVSVGIQIEGRPGSFIDPNSVTSADRLRPALLPLLFVATLLMLARMSTRGVTPRRVAAMMLYGSLWAISFNRSSWLPLIAACGLFVIFRPGERNVQRSLLSLLSLLLLLPATFALAADGRLGPVARGVIDRAETIRRPDLFTSSSYKDRARENADARSAIARSPVFGVGIGNRYGARRFAVDSFGREFEYDRLFVHDSWLQLYLNLGLAGIAAFVVLASQIVGQVRASVRLPQTADAARAFAAGLAILGAAVEAIFNPNLLNRPSIVALAVAVTLAARPVDARV